MSISRKLLAFTCGFFVGRIIRDLINTKPRTKQQPSEQDPFTTF